MTRCPHRSHSLKVAAQSRGPAVANVSQRLPLLAGQHRIPASQEIAFDECGRHRPVPADVLSSVAEEVEIERIQRTGRGTDGHIGDVQIARGGFQVGVAEQDLNSAEIDAGFEQMCGESVTQRVGMNGFGDARSLRGFPASQEDGFGRNGPGRIRAGEQPIGGPLVSPVATQKLAAVWRQRVCRSLRPLPWRTHSTLRALSMSLTFSWVTSMTLSPAAIQDGQQGAMAKIARGLQQGFHFFPAQNQRQLPFPPWKRNAFDRDFSVERVWYTGIAVRRPPG